VKPKNVLFKKMNLLKKSDGLIKNQKGLNTYEFLQRINLERWNNILKK
jgi:hypothetical protein